MERPGTAMFAWGIPWPYGMAIDPEGLGGANLRLVLGQAMAEAVNDRQDLFRPVWQRMIRYGGS